VRNQWEQIVRFWLQKSFASDYHTRVASMYSFPEAFLFDGIVRQAFFEADYTARQ
jgi:hypothetical protein